MSWNFKSIPVKAILEATDQNHKRWIEQLRTTEILLKKLETSVALILGDEVGMGKTWIGLMTAIAVAQTKRVLILVPNKVLASQWREQFRDLVRKKYPEDQREKLLELLTSGDYYDEFIDLLKDGKSASKGIYITTFNAINARDPNWVYRNNMGKESFFELLIIDEGHKFKNSFTQRFQIFRSSPESDFREPLKNQFRRLLIMTATPFQLNHQDLQVILGIGESSSADAILVTDLQLKVKKLTESLTSYKSKLNAFEKRFQKLKTESQIIQLEKLIEDSTQIQNPDPYVYDLAKIFLDLLATKQSLNEDMKAFIIRNTKSKEKRKPKEIPITIDDSSKFTFFLGDSLQRAKLSDKKTGNQVALLTSSFARFDDFLKTECITTAQKHYAGLVASLRQIAFHGKNHPKIDLIVEHAFENWLRGNKTLIFVFYLNTLKELNDKLEFKITEFIGTIKKLFEHVDTDNFIKKLSNSDHLESLVFRDNLFKISLLPLIKQIDPSEQFLDDFLTLSESDYDDLIRFLAKIRYPVKSKNYFMLLSALSHVYFNKYNQKLKRKNAIPENLKDDFLAIMDPDALLFKDVLRHHDLPDEEAESRRLSIIKENVMKAIPDKNAIKKIVMYPTLWEEHRHGIEHINIKERLNFTEVVWSYLTTDEFIFMDLLNGKSILPTIEDIPEIYKKSKLSLRESTFSRISRFLESAKEMDPDNLDNLVEDINFRYKPNKRDIGKMIVESVKGGEEDKKQRTVTAFKTPLPPYIVISTSVLAEGVDLHKECDDIIHYDHEWNPANLEQKIGRLDRVGCKGERTNKIDIHYPYILGTQDEKAFRIVMARKSWFGAVMGEKYDDKWQEDGESENTFELPLSLQEKLVMKLGNEAH